MSNLEYPSWIWVAQKNPEGATFDTVQVGRVYAYLHAPGKKSSWVKVTEKNDNTVKLEGITPEFQDNIEDQGAQTLTKGNFDKHAATRSQGINNGLYEYTPPSAAPSVSTTLGGKRKAKKKTRKHRKSKKRQTKRR